MTDDDLFTQAVAVLLDHEGGYSDVGPTNFGFDARFNPDLSAEQIKSMTRDQAIARYRERWFNPWRWRELPPSVAIKCFDLAVNMGPSNIIRCLQRALWANGTHVKEDGGLGTITITAAADVPEAALLAAVKSEAAGYYRTDCAKHPERNQYLAGWLARAYS